MMAMWIAHENGLRDSLYAIWRIVSSGSNGLECTSSFGLLESERREQVKSARTEGGGAVHIDRFCQRCIAMVRRANNRSVLIFFFMS